MLLILKTLVTETIGKIISLSIDWAKETISTKRKMSYLLLELYNSLEELQKVSRAVAAEFRGYADGSRTLTRTMPQKYLKQLQDEVDNYHATLQKIETIVRIYNNDLAGMLCVVHVTKMRTIEKLAVILPVIPTPGYEILYPTKTPNDALYSERTSFDIADYADDERMRLRYGLEKMDLRDRQKLSELLADVEDLFNQMESSKKALGNFIKKNFRISELV
jgi:hypothetical protein